MSLSSIIDQIKQYPLSDVIGHYIPVKREGTGHAALCPFHGDSKPSLKISDSKKLFKCFACDHAGDHISFVQDYKRVEFIEAVKEIADFFSIPTDSLEQKKKDPKEEMAFRVLTSANKLFKKYADTNHKAEYDEFLKSRGLDVDVAEAFGIGFAPKGSVFLKYLRTIAENERDFAMKIASDIGIVKTGKSGQYDAFRERITFPIKDQFGQVRGYSCRAVREDQEPKYLNSHESFIFHKRNILFGLDVAKSNIRRNDFVIVCEGNMDAIALHQFGFNNSVATMGIALSEFAINRLKGMTSHFYLAMDNDKAGFRAMEKINSELLPIGVYAKFIDLEPAKDPDDFLQEFGRIAFQERIDDAKTFIDVLIDSKIPKTIPDSPDEKHDILVNQIFPILAPLGSNLMATERVIGSAKKLGFQSDSSVLIASYQQFLAAIKKKEARYAKAPTPAAPVKRAAVTQNTNNPTYNSAAPEYDGQPPQDLMHSEDMIEHSQNLSAQPVIDNTISKLEKVLLKELLEQPQTLNYVVEGKVLDFVQSNEVKKLIGWLSKLYLEVDDNEFINVVRGAITTTEFGHEIKEIVSSILFSVRPTLMDEEVVQKLLRDLQKKLEVDLLKTKRRELVRLQKSSPLDKAQEIMAEINKLDIELITLKMKKARP
jgi:DNA primase